MLPVTSRENNMPGRKISNSETSAFLACERKWYYAHSLNLKPKAYSTSLSRGIIGHDALAAYYDNHFDPRAAEAVIMPYLSKAEGDEYKMLMDLLALLNRYFAVDPIKNKGWEILAVEQQYDTELTDDYDFSMRLDLLCKDENGLIVLVDHKFVYDFWQQTAFDLNAQFAKYIVSLRSNGVLVDRVMVNELRHRVNPIKSEDDALFRQTFVTPSATEQRTVFKDHMKVSEKIIAMRELPIEVQSETVIRNMSAINCKNCSFPDLCKTELMGGDITLSVQTYYEPNTYGYNDKDKES